MSLTINGITKLAELPTSYWLLPAGPTSQRPDNPTIGMIRYNTDIDYMEIYLLSGWKYFRYEL